MEETKQKILQSQEYLDILNKKRLNVRVMDMDEAQYRAHPAVSYSKLSEVESVGEEAVHGVKKDISKLRGVVLGSVVDYVISNKLAKLPPFVVKVEKSPGAGTITDLAIDLLVQETSAKKLEEIADIDLEHFLDVNHFMRNGMNSSTYLKKMYNYEDYIDKKLKHKGDDNAVYINSYDLTIVKLAIKRLRKMNVFTAEYKDSPEYELIYQQKFLAELDGIEIKCMLDACYIDHVNKLIKPIDIKTGVLDKPEPEAFFDGPYLTYNYYIQAGLYRKVLQEYFAHHVDYQDYSVEPFKFVYSCTNPKTAVLVDKCFTHDVSEDQHLVAFRGFHFIEKDGTAVFKKGIGELFRFYREKKLALVEKQDE